MSTAQITRPRKPPSYDGPQTITRIPPYRPGQWVKVRDLGDLGHPASGRVRKVKSLTCSITAPAQRRAIWRVHFEPDGCSLDWHLVERHATIAERVAAERRNGG